MVRLNGLFFVALLVLMASPSTAKNSRPWADLRIIDVHGHIGRFEGYDLSLSTLQRNVSIWDIDLVLISNIDGAQLPGTTNNLNEKKSNEVTLHVVRKDPRMRGLAWARPVDGCADNLVPFVKQKEFVGIKLHPDMNNFPADDARVDPYLKLCERFSIPAVVHCGRGNSSAKRIYALAKRHKSVPIVLYHMGFGTDHEEAVSCVEQSIKSKDANLYLETAQADPAKVLAAIKRVGSKRVLFGTDATYYGKQHYDFYVPLMDSLRSKLKPAELNDVLHANAERLFKLSLTRK